MAVGAETAGHLEPVHARQAQVEDEEVDGVPQPGVERGGPVLPHLDLVSLAAQGARERLRDGRVILGEQYTGHGLMVVRGSGRPGRSGETARPGPAGPAVPGNTAMPPPFVC